MTSRYVGKPFLRLLECYVLDAMGALHADQAEVLRLMEPKLGETYGMKGTWQQIVSAQMSLPDVLPGKIRVLWESQLETATARGSTINPGEFATAFVDQNFPDVVAAVP